MGVPLCARHASADVSFQVICTTPSGRLPVFSLLIGNISIGIVLWNHLSDPAYVQKNLFADQCEFSIIDGFDVLEEGSYQRILATSFVPRSFI